MQVIWEPSGCKVFHSATISKLSFETLHDINKMKSFSFFLGGGGGGVGVGVGVGVGGLTSIWWWWWLGGGGGGWGGGGTQLHCIYYLVPYTYLGRAVEGISTLNFAVVKTTITTQATVRRASISRTRTNRYGMMDWFDTETDENKEIARVWTVETKPSSNRIL